MYNNNYYYIIAASTNYNDMTCRPANVRVLAARNGIQRGPPCLPDVYNPMDIYYILCLIIFFHHYLIVSVLCSTYTKRKN